ncbi:hypothetical protein GCM10025768_08240 [Microbacterium pseudoresistens]|uniref:Signal peptidase I n=1 Tax=Microbacterium pseudoresistens TaxID=640634 RepID=A0A7Y9EVF2_9MICO|nr:signal peptidase I [Microbacterium pseudoresistens]NYD54660.1 signal peptidase [Microbacterium pseudoresistens]
MSAPTTRRELREQRATAGEHATPAVAPSVRVPRAHSVLADLLLWVAAIAGVICLVLVILAFSANITLIMFRTGSMAPTIPTGSVAVVQRIPASEIAVGDVVTVDRQGELPVTHRVRSVEPGSTDAQRVIVLRGDANVDDDPFPYTVESVRIVRFAIPGLAPVIVTLGNPFVLGAITIAAAGLVGWAFWPRESGRRSREPDESGSGS